MKQYGYAVKSFDLYTKTFKYGFTKNFLEYNKPCENIVMNPPYAICTEFLLHGLSLIENKLAAILRLNFIETSGRYKSIFNKYPITKLYVYSNRLDMRPGANKLYGGMTTYAWFVWDKNSPKNKTILELICD